MYNPELARYMQPDPIGVMGGMNIYSYVENNPLSATDPEGLDCAALNGLVSCSLPGRATIQFPQPLGWPQSFKSGTPNYHYYNNTVSMTCADTQDVINALILNPTPSDPSPATFNGTPNDATPSSLKGIIPNPVISYLINGNTIVNVTQPGHKLFPGYVARSVTKTSNGVIINNLGEGTGLLQSTSIKDSKGLAVLGLDKLINSVWHGQVADISSTIPVKCSCKE